MLGTAGSQGSEMSISVFPPLLLAALPLSGLGPHSCPADGLCFRGSKHGRQQLPCASPPASQEEGEQVMVFICLDEVSSLWIAACSLGRSLARVMRYCDWPG